MTPARWWSLLPAALLAAVGAGAHAFLDRAQPAVGSTVHAPPGEVSLWFTERIEAAFSSVKVTDERGERVDAGELRRDPADPARLIVPLRAIDQGSFVVTWRAVSVDTHATSGDFRFRVVP